MGVWLREFPALTTTNEFSPVGEVTQYRHKATCGAGQALKADSHLFNMSKITNSFKKLTNKVFHRRGEDRSRPQSSLDVSSRSTVSLNDNISKSATSAVPNQSQDTTLSSPRTASLHSSAPSRVDMANQALIVPGTIEKADRQRSEERSTSVLPSQQSALVKAAWKGLETALRLLEKSAGAFPPLKSAVGGLVACLDLTQVDYCFGFDLLDVVFEVDLRRSSGTVKSMKI